MKEIKIGFFLGLGLGFVISSLIMFSVAMGEMKQITDNKEKRTIKSNNAFTSAFPILLIC